MIGKQIKGKGFLGVLNYVLDREKGYRIGGNMDGQTPKELSREFSESKKLNPDLAKPVYHVSLSLSPGEKLNDFEWSEVANRYMAEMGFEFSQFVAVRHTDKDHDHLHIVGSRIGLDGMTVSDSQNYRRSEAVIRGIEKDYGLQRVAPSREIDRKGITSGELRKAIKEQQPSIKMRMQGKLDACIKRSLTMSDFVKNVRGQGIEVIPNMASTGRVTGLSFSLDGEIMKGSDLGKSYTFGGLQKRGIDYHIERDRDVLSDKNENVRVSPGRELRIGESVRGQIKGIVSDGQRQFLQVSSGKEQILAPVQELKMPLQKLKSLAGKEITFTSGRVGIRLRLKELEHDR